MALVYINADTGNDSTGDGSSGLPYLTIDKGLTTMSTGDTVYLENATATYAIASTTHRILTLASITVQGESKTGVVLDGAGIGPTGSNHVWKLNTLGMAVVWKDITIQNFDHGTNGAEPMWKLSKNNITLLLQNIIFKDFIISSNYDLGGLASFDNSTLANGSTITVKNCDVLDWEFDSGYTPASGWGQSSLFGNRQASTAGYVIQGTTIRPKDADNAGVGARIVGSTVGTSTIKNSIFQTDSASNLKAEHGNGTLSYSCFHDTADTPTGTGVITTDPLFVDVANGNVDLQPGSPAGWGTGVLV